ncbi:MAG: topoisomerase IV, partial [Clostridia bacterium]|nr:topoisomerase IV [Clostridia bacterium]
IEEMQSILESKAKIKRIIIDELTEVIKKYGVERKTAIVAAADEDLADGAEELDDSPVTLFFTRDGYFKKITPQSLRMSGEQKLKDGDKIVQTVEAANNYDLLFFTSKQQVYKSRAIDFADGKASVLGDYVAGKLDYEEGESSIYMVATKDYTGFMLFVFDNGRIAKVPLSSYETKTNRKKLIKAYCDKYKLHSVFHFAEDRDIILKSSSGKMLIVNTGSIPLKSSKENGGIAVMTQKKGQRLYSVKLYSAGKLEDEHRYRTKNLPAAGSMPQTGKVTQAKLDI